MLCEIGRCFLAGVEAEVQVLALAGLMSVYSARLPRPGTASSISDLRFRCMYSST